MELPLKGGCMCGAVRYEITCEPTRVYACHCTDCQRATTSAFSIGVAVPAEAFRLSGKELRDVPGGVTDSGRAKTRWVMCRSSGRASATAASGRVRSFHPHSKAGSETGWRTLA